MVDKERVVVAVEITSDVNYKLLRSAIFTNYGTNGTNIDCFTVI